MGKAGLIVTLKVSPIMHTQWAIRIVDPDALALFHFHELKKHTANRLEQFHMVITCQNTTHGKFSAIIRSPESMHQPKFDHFIDFDRLRLRNLTYTSLKARERRQSYTGQTNASGRNLRITEISDRRQGFTVQYYQLIFTSSTCTVAGHSNAKESQDLR